VTEPLLSLAEVHAHYGDSHALQGVSLEVATGSVTSLLGRNGAGKTTTLKAIMGIVPVRRGAIRFAGGDLVGKSPHRIARAGIGYVPETRGIFPSLSVLENLTLAQRGNGGAGWTLDRVFELFPRLEERRKSGGDKLSGGEQQMLSIAMIKLLLGIAEFVAEPRSCRAHSVQPSDHASPMVSTPTEQTVYIDHNQVKTGGVPWQT
jgi:branched-chain amino acid transport system ATP-binding protein